MVNNNSYISTDGVNLDYDALLFITTQAVRLAKEEASRSLAAWDNWGGTPGEQDCTVLERSADTLVCATKMINILEAGLNLPFVTVIGKKAEPDRNSYNKIAMIKFLRDRLAEYGISTATTGFGLKETKDAVEGMMDIAY